MGSKNVFLVYAFLLILCIGSEGKYEKVLFLKKLMK